MGMQKAREILEWSGCFDREWYLQSYPEVLEQGRDPVDDYLIVGVEKGRNPNPFFDNDFYIRSVSELPEGINPLLHYCQQGWKAFHDPSELFSTWWYVVSNPDCDWEETNPLAHFLHSDTLRTLLEQSLAEPVLSVKNKVAFNKESIELFHSLPLTAADISRVSASLERMRQYDLADMFMVRACELAPDSYSCHLQLARILVFRGGWLRLVNTSKTLVDLAADEAEGYFLHALAHNRLEHFSDAVQAYRRAVALDPGHWEWFYGLGCCEEASGHIEAAKQAYTAAVELAGNAGDLGLGLLHEWASDYPRAARAYSQRGELDPDNAELRFRQGLMFDYCYEWEQALPCYQNAVARDSGNSAYHFRLGSLHERMGQFTPAAEHYRQALHEPEDAQTLNYRLGYVLWQAGQVKEACSSWCALDVPPVLEAHDTEEALAVRLLESRQDADVLVRMGHVLSRAGRLSEAADVYAEAVARRSQHDPADHYALGCTLMALSRFDEACEAFSNMRLIKRPVTFMEAELETFDIKCTYAECIDTLPVRDDWVLYESFQGAEVGCNPYALFRELLGRPEHENLLHIWVVKSEQAIPSQYLAHPRVIFILHNTPLYLRYLATAGYLINNTTFMPYFVRRQEQRYLNTWHGTPLKTLGRDVVAAGPFDHKNIQRNLLQATHLIFPNQHTLDCLLDSTQARDWYSGKLAITGYPRIDLMLNAGPERQKALRALAGADDGRPIVLYAPTWRESRGTPTFDVQHLLDDLQALSRLEANLILSAHHFVAGIIQEAGVPVRLLPAEVDITEFMSVVDILVTDYSSVCFDFLAMQRPIIRYTHDEQAYQHERGLYLDMPAIPGIPCRTRQELLEVLEDQLCCPTLAREQVQSLELYGPCEDGRAAARVLEFFLDKGEGVQLIELPVPRKRILFYAGSFLPNGITSAFLRLIEQLVQGEIAVGVAVDPWTVESYPQRMEKLSELIDGVSLFGRISFPAASYEENWLDGEFQRRSGELPQRALDVLKARYGRELSRLYGSVQLDAAIDFSGYSYFWTSLFAQGRPVGVAGLYWAHNDMQAEVELKYPYLKTLLRLSAMFDRVVSVSEGVGQKNSNNLSTLYGVPRDRFYVVRNCINVEGLLIRAAEPVDAEWYDWAVGSLLVGGIGRLSPEKNFSRLLRAFARVQAENPDMKLVIAGQGPEEERLAVLVRELGLEGSVRLLGYIANPYPLFKRLDLFILPSDHEGQPIVLLEALALGCPVIATDIPGSRSVLQGTAGVLVDVSDEGVYTGLKSFVNNEVNAPIFDAKTYQAEVVQEFFDTLSEAFVSKNIRSVRVEC